MQTQERTDWHGVCGGRVFYFSKDVGQSETIGEIAHRPRPQVDQRLAIRGKTHRLAILFFAETYEVGELLVLSTDANALFCIRLRHLGDVVEKWAIVDIGKERLHAALAKLQGIAVRKE